LEGTDLVWWERKLHDKSKYGKILSSWSEFKSTIRKQFCPLGYLHKSMMEWKNLRKSKGQIVQSFIEEFRKKALALNIPLGSYENLMKYIGALHSYIQYTLLLFKPTILDEVFVQDTQLENRGKHVQEDPTKKPSNFPRNNFKKFKRKDKNTATVTREGEKPSCTHCKKSGHDEEQCWKLHPERNINNLVERGRQRPLLQCNKIVVPIQEMRERSQ
jgi:hypothetical protein